MSLACDGSAATRRECDLPARSRRRGLALALGLGVLLLVSGCARLLTRPSPTVARAAAAIVAAGAARERAQTGLRLTLSVRATAGPPAARLASPAYLAIEDPDHLRLQVLSPFGITVLDLATAGERFTLTLPLRNETREGRIDLAALAAGTTPDDERMIVALALLFRPKMRAADCRGAGPAAVRCELGAGLSATVTVDEALRPTREEYQGADGRIVLVATLTGYPDGARDTLPERITISEGGDGPALVVRILRARRLHGPPAS